MFLSCNLLKWKKYKKILALIVIYYQQFNDNIDELRKLLYFY